MSKKFCDYNGCTNVRNVHGKITFFSLPNDCRRKIWIENSGSEELKLISDKTVRFICEEHFEEKYLRKQFSRTTLSRSAVPLKYCTKNDTSSTAKKNKGKHNLLINSNHEQRHEFDNVLNSIMSDETYAEASDNSKQYCIEYDLEYLHEVSADESPNVREVHLDSENANDILEETSSSSTRESKSERNDNMVLKNDRVDTIFELVEDSNDTNQCEVIAVKRTLNSFASTAPLQQMKYEFITENEITSSTGETKLNQTQSKKNPEKKILNNIAIDQDVFDAGESFNVSLNTVKLTQNRKPSSMADDYEEDKHFALSLVGNFQRLPQQKKALAKIKILQYLTNLEFSDSENLDI